MAPAPAIDPVCGMKVDPSAARGGSHEYGGTTYYFCSPGCREKFAKDPQHWLDRGPAPMSHAAPVTLTRRATPQAPSPERAQTDTRVEGQASSPEPQAEYTCPMHPDVVQRGPGHCPICGMDLERIVVYAAHVEQAPPEVRQMTRRFWIAVALASPLLAWMAVDLIFGHDATMAIGMRTRRWIELALATPVCLWAAWPFHVRAVDSVRRGNLNMFTLIGLGVATAYGYSVVATLAPGIFPASALDATGSVPAYFEAAAVIVALVLLGQVLELRARYQTVGAINALLNLRPLTARRIRADGQEEDISLADVESGDRLRVRPGERVPADGVVLEGSGAVDESLMTGESLPVGKQTGDRVIGSTTNTAGSFVLRAEHVGRDSLLARIITMVGQAIHSRAPIQRLADVISGYFVIGVIVVAVAAFVIWMAWGPEPRLAHALLSAVAVLIIACPCALGLATPMSIMVASGRGATMGILFRNAEAIERTEKVDTLLFDKTGTLTEGKPAVLTMEGASDDLTWLGLAAGVARASEHPLSAAIVRAAAERGLAVTTARDFVSVAGKGVKGRASGHDVAIGNERFLADLAIDVSAFRKSADARRERGETVVFVSVDGRAAGWLGIADPIKASTPAALAALRGAGLRLAMVTGDHPATATAVARTLGLDDVAAGASPEDKLTRVRDLQRAGHVVAMAGDGVNDSPALAKADVGIAMGTGTDVAMASAQITLVKGDLTGIARARRLSQLTMANIRQNLFFAFVYNAVGVPIAAGALYPFTGLLLSPMIAAAAMSFSSVSVIANALRLRRAPL